MSSAQVQIVILLRFFNLNSFCSARIVQRMQRMLFLQGSKASIFILKNIMKLYFVDKTNWFQRAQHKKKNIKLDRTNSYSLRTHLRLRCYVHYRRHCSYVKVEK